MINYELEVVWKEAILI